jgi:hypothetical protein
MSGHARIDDKRSSLQFVAVLIGVILTANGHPIFEQTLIVWGAESYLTGIPFVLLD